MKNQTAQESDVKIVIEQNFLSEKTRGNINKVTAIYTKITDMDEVILEQRQSPERYQKSDLKKAIDSLTNGKYKPQEKSPAKDIHRVVKFTKGELGLLRELLQNELSNRPNFHRRFHLSELLHRIEEQMFSAPQYVKSKENYLAQSPQKHSKHNNNRQSERVQKILLLKVPTEISPQEIEDVLKQILGKTYSHHHGPQV